MALFLAPEPLYWRPIQIRQCPSRTTFALTCCEVQQQLLGLVNEEAPLGSRPVGFRGQFFMELPQFAFEVEVQCGHVGSEAFAFASLLGGMEQAVEGEDFGPRSPWRFMLCSRC